MKMLHELQLQGNLMLEWTVCISKVAFLSNIISKESDCKEKTGLQNDNKTVEVTEKVRCSASMWSNSKRNPVAIIQPVFKNGKQKTWNHKRNQASQQKQKAKKTKKWNSGL